MNAYTTNLTMLNTNDSGTTPNRKVLCIHTWEGDWPARRMGEYHLTSTSGSYHITIDKNGTSCRENDDPYITWSAMYTGNKTAWHFCLAGYARWTRQQWLDRKPQLETLAQILAAYSKKYGIPLIKIGAKDLRNGKSGICGHIDISEAWGETDHWDPGHNFPYDVVLKRAKEIRDGKDKPVDNKLTTYAKNSYYFIKRTFEQLAGYGYDSKGRPTYPGWPQLGDRTVVDALAAIGTHLGIEGFTDGKTKH